MYNNLSLEYKTTKLTNSPEKFVFGKRTTEHYRQKATAINGNLRRFKRKLSVKGH